MFHAPKVTPPPPPAPPPNPPTLAAAAAPQSPSTILGQAGGLASTILSSPLGVASPGMTTRKTLLGA